MELESERKSYLFKDWEIRNDTSAFSIEDEVGLTHDKAHFILRGFYIDQIKSYDGFPNEKVREDLLEKAENELCDSVDYAPHEILMKPAIFLSNLTTLQLRQLNKLLYSLNSWDKTNSCTNMIDGVILGRITAETETRSAYDYQI